MEEKPTLLIVEDDPGLQKQLKWALKTDYELLFADNREDAIALFNAHEPAVIVHDLGLPPDEKGVSEGKSSIQSILERSPSTRIIVMTGKGDKNDAIDLIGLGAHDFFPKPFETEALKLVLQRAHFLADLEHKAVRGQPIEKENEHDLFVLPGVVGRSKIMQGVADRVQKIARTSASVFIQGKSGTGKELIARAIHNLSLRSDQPFIAINCAAIPESLLESELFGYEKGAFTGANKRTLGKIEQAQDGTLFLDEIGDMAYELQSKILRVLQERVLNRVGGNQDIPVDIRIITATHQDITSMITAQQFREDLYYRINEIEVELPELSERGDDILLIADYLLKKFAETHGKIGLAFSTSALNSIQNTEWQGNIRQLSNQINKAVILSEGQQITEQDMNFNTREISKTIHQADDESFEDLPTLKQAKEQTEFKLVSKALEANANNVMDTARQLGVSRQRVYELIKKHQIQI
jgi:two-component system NtrC family response regulator